MRSMIGPIIVPTRRSRAPWFVLALLFAAVFCACRDGNPFAYWGY